MRHLDSIEFEDTNYKLGPLTVIVGPNGSGKSALLYAIAKATRLANAYADPILFDSQLRKSFYRGYLEKIDLAAVAGLIPYKLSLNRIYTEAVNEVNPNYQKVTMHEEILVHTIDGRTIQEGSLSNGTHNFLVLSALLANAPNTLLLDCPEVGLHPDLLLSLLDKIKNSIEKGSQITLVTHSDILLSLLGRYIDILITMGGHSDLYTRTEYQYVLDTRKQNLGDLWLTGELGGCRW